MSTTVAFDLKVVHQTLRARLKEFSELSSKAFYGPVLKNLYSNDPGYGHKRLRAGIGPYQSADDEIAALEKKLEGIHEELQQLVSYSLRGPKYFSSDNGYSVLLDQYGVMSSFGNSSRLNHYNAN